MRIETLNRIKHFADNPSAEGLADILAQFNSVIEEEFFWICVSNQNKTHIYELLIKTDVNYFINKFSALKNEANYNQIHFRIFRFLIEVSKTTDKTNNLFTHLNETIVFLIELIGNNLPQNKQQIMFFISEIILELPLKSIDDKHISFLANFSLSSNVSFIGASIIEKFIPRIIEEQNGVLLRVVLDRLVFSIKAEDYKDDLYRSGYDGYNVSHIVNEDKVLTFSKLIGSDELIDFTVGKIKSIIDKAPYNFSHLSISTIEDSSQILDKNKYEFILVKFLRIQIEIHQLSEALIDSFLKSQYGIFQRLAVYHLNRNYEKLKGKFWSIATSNFFINPEIKHEVFMLLKDNADSITKDEVSVLIAALDGMRDFVINETLSKEDIVYYNTLLAKEYLLAFEDCKTEIKATVTAKLEEMNKVVPGKISNPGYSIYFDHSIAIDKNREEYSETFNKEDLPKFFDIAEGGFKDMQERDALKIVNRINYLLRDDIRFVMSNQERLIKMGLENFYELPNFFEKAWFDKLDINWGDVFVFFGKVIDANYSKNPGGYEHFISYCAWLIRSTTRDDNHALEGNALEEAKNLCLKFLNLGIRNERLNKDPFFDILNSTDGKIFDATLEVLLRNARLNKKKNDADKWYPDIKDFYSKNLESGQQWDAIIWSLSMHLPQFGYLNMQWLQDHINQIFPKEKMDLWLLAMRGYHKYCSQVYKIIYDFLLMNGHYDLALSVFKDDQHGTDDIFEHIVMAYVANWPGSELDNSESLISKTLRNGNRSQVHGLINFFLKNKNFPPPKMLVLWKVILNSPAIKDKLVYNDLLLLFTNLKSLDTESFELIKTTLSNITTNQVIHRLIYNLFEMENADPIFQARVLLEINEPDFEGFYKQDEFAKLAQRVIKSDLKFGQDFIKKMIEKRLFNLLDVYNKSSQLN